MKAVWVTAVVWVAAAVLQHHHHLSAAASLGSNDNDNDDSAESMDNSERQKRNMFGAPPSWKKPPGKRNHLVANALNMITSAEDMLEDMIKELSQKQKGKGPKAAEKRGLDTNEDDFNDDEADVEDEEEELDEEIRGLSPDEQTPGEEDLKRATRRLRDEEREKRRHRNDSRKNKVKLLLQLIRAVQNLKATLKKLLPYNTSSGYIVGQVPSKMPGYNVPPIYEWKGRSVKAPKMDQHSHIGKKRSDLDDNSITPLDMQGKGKPVRAPIMDLYSHIGKKRSDLGDNSITPLDMDGRAYKEPEEPPPGPRDGEGGAKDACREFLLLLKQTSRFIPIQLITFLDENGKAIKEKTQLGRFTNMMDLYRFCMDKV